MDKKQKDLEALLQLLAFAQDEAKRLKLTEATKLMELPALSIFLEYIGLTVDDLENRPNWAAEFDQFFRESAKKRSKVVLID